jgi:hypothetical protein
MKKLLSVSLFGLFSHITFCQHSQLSLSEDFKIAEKEYKDQTVAHSVYYNNSFYTATNSGIGSNYKWAFTKLYDLKYAVTISKFDRNMNKVKQYDLENGEKHFGPLEPELILLNNKLCLAYFQSDNKSSFNLYLALVDDVNLTIKEPKKICAIQQDNVGIFKLESVLNAGLVFFTHSVDNMKTLVACKASPNTLLTFVADNDLNILKQTVVHTNTTGFDISSAILTNDNIECLILSSQDETKVVCLNAEGRKTEMKLNPLGNLFPYVTNASLAKDGKSIYVYSTATIQGDDNTPCNGLLLSQLDCGTLKLSKPLAYEFGPEVIESIYQKGGGSKHKKDYWVNNFTPGLVELDNGNIVILGSSEKVSTTSSTSAPNMNNQTHEISTTTLEVGPVMAFFLNKAGKTFDHALIPRKISISKSAGSGSGAIQMVQSPGISHSYSSFTVTNLGDGIVIVYNDIENNLNKDVNEKIAEAHSAGDLVLAEALINNDKKLQYRKQVGKNLSGKNTYFLGNTIPAASSSIIFPIAREGAGFNQRKTFYTNWCFLEIK